MCEEKDLGYDEETVRCNIVSHINEHLCIINMGMMDHLMEIIKDIAKEAYKKGKEDVAKEVTQKGSRKMGQSTDAILCYGFRIFDEDEEEENVAIPWLRKNPDDDNCYEMLEWNEFLLKLNKLEEPSIDIIEKLSQKNKEEGQKLWKKWHDIKKDLEEKCPITLISHCSLECPMYILALKESVKCAWRGCPIEFPKNRDIVVQAGWNKKLRDFCKFAKIEIKEPSWILCSNWC